MKDKLLFCLLVVGIIFQSNISAQPVENLFFITLDGLRWQELFSGADAMLITETEYVKDTQALKDQFWRITPEERRATLLPFFWNTIAQEGQIYGNRNLGNKMNCSNIFWFSYPGYAELLVGETNAKVIHSNEKVLNPDTTFLEYLNRSSSFKDQVASFCSWDVFPFIINEPRSNIPVNAGFEPVAGHDLNERESFLNLLQEEIPSPWSTVRLDAFTHHFAMEYVQKHHPRVLYLAYGETDDFAHDGRYDHYLSSAHRTDAWIYELWQMVQSDSFYRHKTAFVITTDHGRGRYEEGAWKSHGKTYEGSDAIWLAVLGPGIVGKGEVTEKQQLWQRQVAGTCLQILGLETWIKEDMGKAIDLTVKR
ncbi:MAG: phosphoglyceromutase [Saprospiraceae bacterium]|nr:phosphoglyceromutase [Saprospiraceae bacterium]